MSQAKTIEVKGASKLVERMSIRMDFFGEGKFHLHLWKPDKKTGGNVGTSFSRPEALRAYALGLLEMADRFEVECRPEFEARGGTWMTPEEIAKATSLTTKAAP